MIQIINGPNLNLLGIREPHIYGSTSFESFIDELRKEFKDIEICDFQSNCEGHIVTAIQEAAANPRCEGIILNPAAYSHYSLAIADAIAAINVPVIEVHISNIHSREEYRKKSVTAERVKGVIAGCGLEGYRLALLYLLKK